MPTLFFVIFILVLLASVFYALGRLHGRADRLSAYRLGFKDGDRQRQEKTLNEARRGFFLNAQRTFHGVAANDAPGYVRWGTAADPVEVGMEPQRELVAAGVGGGEPGGRHRQG